MARRRPGNGAPRGAAVAIALVAGLVLGAVLYHFAAPSPRVRAAPAPSAPKGKPNAPKVAAPPPPHPPKGPAPGLPAATQFDFYTLLPRIHHQKAAKSRKGARRVFPHARSHPVRAEVFVPAHRAPRGRELLQVASFPTRGDAERLRARLKRRGLVAFIEKARVSGRRFYRVRIGPLGQKTAAKDRRLVDRLGLKPLVLHVR